MRLCSYIVPFDVGLAPNPFWGYCTLAVCSPNHRGVKASVGDWFVGVSSKKRGNKMIYAMQVSEKLNFDDYYYDKRFLAKRPKLSGNWKEQCGDNFYFLDESGSWQQAPTHYHKGAEYLKKDTKYPTVFIAQKFYYFGEKAVDIDPKFSSHNFGVRLKYNNSDGFIEDFVSWLELNFSASIYGDPFDKKAYNTCDNSYC